MANDALGISPSQASMENKQETARKKDAARKRAQRALWIDTRPYLQDLLLIAIEAWFNDEDADFSPIPPIYSTLILQQTRIGWRQLFNGRISTEWARLQDEYLPDQGLHTKKKTGLLWATQLLTSIWEGWNLVWTIRNEVIHGHDQASRHRIQRQEVEHEIKAIYDEREHLLPADQDHLFDDVETHLTHSTPFGIGSILIKAYLLTVSPRRNNVLCLASALSGVTLLHHKRELHLPRMLLACQARGSTVLSNVSSAAT
jgi:hypothetical protein